ncbi:MAG: sugar ABC transporter permease [Oscillospiraceae bacterium]|nr:sugar ABC transporter permease [Oscillospiraceae bacterium]
MRSKTKKAAEADLTAKPAKKVRLKAVKREQIKSKTGRKERIKDFLRSLCFLCPSFLGVCLFFIVPFIVVVKYAVTDSSAADAVFVGIENFKKLMANAAFKLAAKNTLTFSALAVPLSVVLAIVLALMLESRIPMKSAFRSFFLSPMMVPVASIVLIWQVLFNFNGSVNVLVEATGGKAIDWLNSDYAQLVVILLFLWKNLGYNMILFMSGLHNIPKELLEYADVEGASEWYKFWAIKLRYLSPTVLFVTILSLINSFKIFREVYLLAGNYPYQGLYTLQHFMNNMFNALDYQKLSAAAIIMALVMIVLIALLFVIENWFGKDVEG